MKIDNSTPSRPLEAISNRTTAKTPAASDTATPSSGPGSITHLSSNLQDSSLDINQARVDEIRQAIRDGKLNFDAGKIADGLLASVHRQLAED